MIFVIWDSAKIDSSLDFGVRTLWNFIDWAIFSIFFIFVMWDSAKIDSSLDFEVRTLRNFIDKVFNNFICTVAPGRMSKTAFSLQRCRENHDLSSHAPWEANIYLTLMQRGDQIIDFCNTSAAIRSEMKLDSWAGSLSPRNIEFHLGSAYWRHNFWSRGFTTQTHWISRRICLLETPILELQNIEFHLGSAYWRHNFWSRGFTTQKHWISRKICLLETQILELQNYWISKRSCSLETPILEQWPWAPESGVSSIGVSTGLV